MSNENNIFEISPGETRRREALARKADEALNRFNSIRDIHFLERSEEDQMWYNFFTTNPDRHGSYDDATLLDIYTTGYNDLAVNLLDYTSKYVNGGFGHAREFTSELGYIHKAMLGLIDQVQEIKLRIARAADPDWF